MIHLACFFLLFILVSVHSVFVYVLSRTTHLVTSITPFTVCLAQSCWELQAHASYTEEVTTDGYRFWWRNNTALAWRMQQSGYPIHARWKWASSLWHQWTRRRACSKSEINTKCICYDIERNDETHVEWNADTKIDTTETLTRKQPLKSTSKIMRTVRMFRRMQAQGYVGRTLSNQARNCLCLWRLCQLYQTTEHARWQRPQESHSWGLPMLK